MIKSHVLYQLSYRLGVPPARQADPSCVVMPVQACSRIRSLPERKNSLAMVSN